MQITLVSSGDTVSDVLNRFEAEFSSIFNWLVTEKELDRSMAAISQALTKTHHICDLKRMTDFLATAFNVADLDTPKRNSKVSLASWVAQVLLSAREAAEVSEAIGTQSDRHPPGKNYWCPQCETLMDRSGFDEILGSDFQEQLCKVCGSEVCHEFDRVFPVTHPVETSTPDPTSGLIISFGKTLEYLPQKSVTRRTWKNAHAQKFINAFTQNKLVRAFDKDPRYGGKQIGWCRLLCAPYKEQLCDIPNEDLAAEGGMCNTIGEFIEQYFDGNPRLEVWVIRFDFIADSVFATETNSVAADQVVDSSTPEVEVLEPEEKPVYTISIIADGAFSEERVNHLPPYLIDRKGNLLKRFWHRSCDAGYSEITSKHLSNIAVSSGLIIKLMAENLEVSQACICGDPPPFIVDRGGVYKRDQVRRGLAVSYSQVVSEGLPSIVVV